MKHTTLFRSILPLCIAGTALFFGACDDNEETEEIGSLLFESKNVTLALDETVQLVSAYTGPVRPKIHGTTRPPTPTTCNGAAAIPPSPASMHRDASRDTPSDRR